MIELQKIGKKFDQTWIFRKISLLVEDQESIVIMGPSGSGKTTLLKIIAGLLDSEEGKLELDDTNMGMVFQKNALFDSLTAMENLLLPLQECSHIEEAQAKQEARRYLNEVGLLDVESLYPNELSGGMQKRLGIARALILKPKILLCDDPTAGLDPITSRKIGELLLKLKTLYKTTLLTMTNDLQRAFQLADRLYVLAQGKLHGGAPKEQILASKDPLISQFIKGLSTGPLTS